MLFQHINFIKGKYKKNNSKNVRWCSTSRIRTRLIVLWLNVFFVNRFWWSGFMSQSFLYRQNSYSVNKLFFCYHNLRVVTIGEYLSDDSHKSSNISRDMIIIWVLVFLNYSLFFLFYIFAFVLDWHLFLNITLNIYLFLKFILLLFKCTQEMILVVNF